VFNVQTVHLKVAVVSVPVDKWAGIILRSSR
ncbi:unnamed protein product, partial [Allacma fusca]